MEKERLVIVWRVTQDCNMNCLFCSYSNEIKRQRDDAHSDDVYRLIHILGDYKQQTCRDMLVSWIGGEPFLYKEMIPMSKKLKTYGIDVSTTTNGTLLNTSKIRKDVVNYFSEIVFSLDGFQECNDRIRKYSGHYNLVVKNISELDKERKSASSDLTIKVNTILLRENIDRFEELCELLIKIGVDELTFNQLGGYDRPEFYSDNRLLPDQVDKFIERFPGVKQSCLSAGLAIHGNDEYFNRIVHSTRNKKISIDECNPGENFWFINENGLISPCSYTSYEYKAPVSGIKTAKDVDLLQDYFIALRREQRSIWCDDCHCTQLYKKFD